MGGQMPVGPGTVDDLEVAHRSLHVVEPSWSARATDGTASGPAGGVIASASAASILHPPAARPGTVVRQALLDRLTESLAAKLVLVVAPAGGGKTSLLRDWWSAGQDSGRAWLSIETAHNDPARVLSSVIAAIGTVSPRISAPDLERLARPRCP